MYVCLGQNKNKVVSNMTLFCCLGVDIIYIIIHSIKMNSLIDILEHSYH